MGLEIKNFNIMEVHWKIRFLGWGEGHEKPVYKGEVPKMGGLDSLHI